MRVKTVAKKLIFLLQQVISLQRVWTNSIVINPHQPYNIGNRVPCLISISYPLNIVYYNQIGLISAPANSYPLFGLKRIKILETSTMSLQINISSIVLPLLFMVNITNRKLSIITPSNTLLN